ncbi:MAG: hypothetical protein EOL97_09785 [Spirochaetia bacterium]|nr:hypothetical protein [Spirochaetia bacterium]
MSNMKLYKGRYLIALYEKDNETLAMNENGIAIFASPKELSLWLNRTDNSVYSGIRHLLNEEKRKLFATYNLHLIDCLEQNNDCFVEEDKLFLQFIEKDMANSPKKINNTDISRRQFYRNKKYYNYLCER